MLGALAFPQASRIGGAHPTACRGTNLGGTLTIRLGMQDDRCLASGGGVKTKADIRCRWGGFQRPNATLYFKLIWAKVRNSRYETVQDMMTGLWSCYLEGYEG